PGRGGGAGEADDVHGDIVAQLPPRRPAPRRSVAGASHGVQGDRDGEGQRGTDVRADLDAVGVPDPEPLLGHLRHLLCDDLELVLVVDDVSLDLDVVPVLDIDLPALSQRSDQGLVDLGHLLGGGPLDAHRVPNVQHSRLDPAEDVATDVLEVQGATHPERLAVDPEGTLAGHILDTGVHAHRDQLLPHLVPRGVTADPELATLLPALLTPLP